MKHSSTCIHTARLTVSQPRGPPVAGWTSNRDGNDTCRISWATGRRLMIADVENCRRARPARRLGSWRCGGWGLETTWTRQCRGRQAPNVQRQKCDDHFLGLQLEGNKLRTDVEKGADLTGDGPRGWGKLKKQSPAFRLRYTREFDVAVRRLYAASERVGRVAWIALG